MEFRRKSGFIEAYQFTKDRDKLPDWIRIVANELHRPIHKTQYSLFTSSRTIPIEYGDWLIRDVDTKKMYALQQEVFEAMYEAQAETHAYEIWECESRAGVFDASVPEWSETLAKLKASRWMFVKKIETNFSELANKIFIEWWEEQSAPQSLHRSALTTKHYKWTPRAEKAE